MSINPVQTIGPVPDAQPDGGQLRPRPQSVAALTKLSSPDTGSSPKQQSAPSHAAPQPYEVPQDEVEVQRDSQTNGAIVIRYVGQGGDVILQIPSAQVLDVARAIDQDLEQEAKTRANIDQEGDNAHGH